MKWIAALMLALAFVTGAEAAQPTLTTLIATPAEAASSGLPLTEVPATLKAERDAVVILVSGDGGWAGLVQNVAAGLAADGLPVVGLNSLRYFWRKRTADETAAAVASVMRHYMSAWNKNRVILVGYSFGADVMPFVVNRLPADLRDKIGAVALLGLSHDATFEFHAANWVGFSIGDTFPTAPEIAKLADLHVLCIYGAEDTISLCPNLAKPVEVLELSGGHRLGDDFKRLAEEILKMARAQ